MGDSTEKLEKDFIQLVEILEGLEKRELESDLVIQRKIEEGASEEELKKLADAHVELNVLIQMKLEEKSELENELREIRDSIK